MNGNDYLYDLARTQQLRRKHPVSSRGTKERPKCRQAIVEGNLVPYPHPEAWDGYSAFTDDGERTLLSKEVATQMRRMLVDGYWKQ